MQAIMFGQQGKLFKIPFQHLKETETVLFLSVCR